ncbi:MAG: DUF2442 domain-containing protein [Candidatus Rifleibacteriota bacterium]
MPTVPYHQVDHIEVKENMLLLEVDGKSLKVNLKQISPVFKKADFEELQNYELSPSGYGIHWPLLDEDVSIDGLLGIIHSPLNKRQTA